MVNILAWSDIRKKFRITADTNKEPAIRVHLGNGEHITFRELKNGLYLGDVKEIQQKLKVKHHNFVNLTSENNLISHSLKSGLQREPGACLEPWECHPTKS